jgi:hypothetical protein
MGVPTSVPFQPLALPTLPAMDELKEALCSSVSSIKMMALYLKARNVLPEN